MEKGLENNNGLKVMLIIFILLSVILGGFILYDKVLKEENDNFIKTESSCDCEKCEKCQEFKECDNTPSQCNCPSVSILGQKISSLKKIKLTHTNQTVKVGNKEFKVKIDDDGEYLSINDYVRGQVYADTAYVTDKYIFFTSVAQSGNVIQYAQGVEGEIGVNDNGYLINDDSFKIVDKYLHASGGAWCGMECELPSKDLLIKFIDNTLIVTETK